MSVRLWQDGITVFPKKKGKGIQEGFQEKYLHRFSLLVRAAGHRHLSALDPIQPGDAYSLSVVLLCGIRADPCNIKICRVQILRD